MSIREDAALLLKKMEEGRVDRLSKLFSLNYDRRKLFHILFKRIRPEHCWTLRQMIKILEQAYKDRWDIQIELKPLFKSHTNRYGGNAGAIRDWFLYDRMIVDFIYIVIHFPSVTLTNSKRDTFDLKDMFIRIPLDPKENNLIIETLQGTRSTLSVAEYETAYLHSHLIRLNDNVTVNGHVVKNRPCTYSEFCTGIGDINILKAMLNNKFDPDFFNSYLLLLQNFLEWESIEGTPYMRINSVVVADYDYPVVSEDECRNFYESLIRHPNSFILDWTFRDGRYEIVDNNKFEEQLRGSPWGTYLYRDETGKYFEEKTQIAREDVVFNEWLPFRGQKIFFRIEGEIKTRGEDALKFIHPKMKAYVKRQLEQRINVTFLREAGAGRYGKGTDPKAGTGQDKVSVQANI